MTTIIPINYSKIWAFIYVSVGVLSFFIFLFGFYLIKDFLFLIYMISAVFPIYIGFKMKNNPYALVSVQKIKIFGLFGELKHEYLASKNNQFVLKNNKLFICIDNRKTKVKINKWFVSQEDWLLAMALFSKKQ